ncbi:hypothetical protein P8917_10065 [Bacillus atrophaeus]|uniref:hypothetical protein n=1 Tax=Bacillus atrophaeus TaxID=1452 RepID=UPI0022825DEA|nr:hypothetical protein [Bacillus atrophaeus]MCY8497744.1 hypothetical protein [Bacillus atrophaeus]MCY8814907.1 hypothetical protein [Bacillus atrophaeus]MCY8821547.1 hypothetical protein [Bacillus atrophaeus]MCY8830977.1 hypothetical protein [Bacillus atrophaeus]MCY8835236.1 hypothetical protein [Bacillus atrophaeus]
MLNRKEFKTENDYRKYTKTSDFLLKYNWKNKSDKEIIQDMALEPHEQTYLCEAMNFLSKKNNFSGMALDRYIMEKIDADDQDDFDINEVIFVERDE